MVAADARRSLPDRHFDRCGLVTGKERRSVSITCVKNGAEDLTAIPTIQTMNQAWDICCAVTAPITHLDQEFSAQDSGVVQQTIQQFIVTYKGH